MKQKLLSILCTFTLMLSLLPLNVSAVLAVPVSSDNYIDYAQEPSCAIRSFWTPTPMSRFPAAMNTMITVLATSWKSQRSRLS